MTTDQLASICKKILPTVKSVGDFIHQEMGKIDEGGIEYKSLNSLVSYVDKTAEERLVEGLQNAVPAASFITEEETIAQSQSNELRWIIDPLDGTTNFLHQLPFYSISIALEHQGEIVLGIVYECVRKEFFYAWKGSPAYLNEKIISVSQRTALSESLLATGFPYYNFEDVDKYLVTLAEFMKGTRGLRRLGSAALDLAYVACGRFDGFYETNLNTWDVAAGVFLVESAGGKTSDFSGVHSAVSGKEILAASPEIYTAMKKVINAADWSA